VLNTQAQLVEFGGCDVQHLHGKAGGHDLVVDDPFGQQLQPSRRTGLGAGVRKPGQQGALQCLATLVQPGGLVLLKGRPGIAPHLHLVGRTGLVQRGRQSCVTRLDQLGKRPSHVDHKELTCLFGERRGVLIG
jgi:hypothetical protein